MSDSESNRANKMDEEHEETQLQDQNEALLWEIADLCNREDIESPDVIFLLGSSGVGKSSIMNTIIRALTGEYLYKAKAGKGNVSSITLAFEWFEHCGVDLTEMQHLQRNAFCGCWQKLPTIIDAAGLAVQNEPAVREILEMVLGGFIPPETSVKHLQKQQNKYGVGCLKTIYTDSRKDWVVTRVVFVASCMQALPTDLIDILHSILEMSDPKTGLLIHNADIFIIISKCDLVEGIGRLSRNSSKKMITMHQLERLEAEIADKFRIDGVQKHTSIRWISHVRGHSKDNPYIDNIALKFIRQMMKPRRKIYQTEHNKLPMMTPLKRIRLNTRKCMKERHAYYMCALFVAVVAVVLVLIYIAQRKPSIPENTHQDHRFGSGSNHRQW